MEIITKLFAIAIAVTSLAFAPSIVNIQPVDAASHWCENQGKSQNWVNGCKQGWYDHDHCYKYDPDGESNAFASGYKVGWKHGSCK
jgi:hypothetical protein